MAPVDARVSSSSMPSVSNVSVGRKGWVSCANASSCCSLRTLRSEVVSDSVMLMKCVWEMIKPSCGAHGCSCWWVDWNEIVIMTTFWTGGGGWVEAGLVASEVALSVKTVATLIQAFA